MTVEIRRMDRMMDDPRLMVRLLQESAVGRLAMSTSEGPYMVPVNFLYHDGYVFFHSAPSGRKMDAIQVDSRVCFQVDDVGPQILWKRGCGISQIYRSVICFGMAEMVDDSLMKRLILEKMIDKYVPSSYLTRNLDESKINNTAIVKIVIDSMTGKAHKLSPEHTVIQNMF